MELIMKENKKIHLIRHTQYLMYGTRKKSSYVSSSSFISETEPAIYFDEL